MAYRLACEPSLGISAVVAVGSAMRQPVDDCHPGRSVSVLHIHGQADQYAPIAGGIGRRQQAGKQPPLDDTLAFWARQSGCTQRQMGAGPRAGITVQHYEGCKDDTEVDLLVVEGLGHQWPGGEAFMPTVFGPQVDDLSATSLAVDFFRAH
jgi:polyhydroxybutyrate depolymerase